MKRLSLIFLIIFILTGCGRTKTSQLNNNMLSKKDLRPASAAGTFYSASKDILEREIKTLLTENVSKVDGRILGLMAPHAGYQYAGPAFASAYSAIKGRPIKTVIIIGNSHHAYFDGISVYNKGGFETPLGAVPVDIEMANAIISENNKISFNESVHRQEHSLEVQLPFIQIALSDFKIVPILMGNDLMDNCKLLAGVLRKVIGKREDVIIIASSDMSHYPPYDEANKVDKEVLDVIQKGDAIELDKRLLELEMRSIPGAVTFLCGSGAVKTVMLAAKEMGADDIQILKYLNSGDTMDKAGVVGYGAVSFAYKENVSSKEEELSEKDKEEILKIARGVVEARVKGREFTEIKNPSPFLQSARGAFVTIKKDGNLRGCIGTFVTTEPLYKVIQEMAESAALSDTRFVPVTVSELGELELEYEISILSPLEKVANPSKDIEVGKHGVQVRDGFRSGVFLPQVATENGWDLETFMNNLCEHKAGISRNAWKNGTAEVYRFTAEIVHE